MAWETFGFGRGAHVVGRVAPEARRGIALAAGFQQGGLHAARPLVRGRGDPERLKRC